MPVCFLGLSLLGVVALVVTGTSGAVPDATLTAILVPIVVIGHVAGRPLFGALARSGSYEKVVTAILLVSVIAGLATALL